MSGIIDIVVIGIIIVGTYYALQSGILNDIIANLSSGISAGGGIGGGSILAPPAAGIGARPPTSTTAPGNCGATMFTKTGKSWTPKYNGGQEITYSSSGEKATSYRWDADGVTSPALEATYYVTWPSGSGSGDHLELKFWGPGHSGNACCYCMFNIDGTGKTGSGHEGPHPDTANFSGEGENVGNIVGKLVGIKGVIWPGSNGAHLEGYVDVGATGKWRKVVTYDGPCGKSKKSTKPVASQQIQFRVDSIEPKMKCATIHAIQPPAGGATPSAFARSYRVRSQNQMKFYQDRSHMDCGEVY